MKLEAGKTYVFKDDACMDEFIAECPVNQRIYNDSYRGGFLISNIDSEGADIEGDGYIYSYEYKLFKEKESTPFDISEYEFSDKDVKECMDTYIEAEFKLSIHICSRVLELNKQDAEAIAKHFKLI